MSGDIHALSGAYAIDALDDIERAEFERHLAQCADCRAEVDGLRAAAAEMSSLTAVTPPPDLRARVLADAATVRPLPPRVSGHRAPRRRLTALVAAAAAAVVLAGAGGAVVWHPWEHPITVPGSMTPVQRVIAAPDAQRFDTSVAGGGMLTLYRSESLNAAAVVAHGMPVAPTGKVYQLWLEDAQGTMHPAGLMAGGPDASIVLDGAADPAKGAGVTVEPAGGSKAPTTKPIALVAFT